jgi:hypothetical protein
LYEPRVLRLVAEPQGIGGGGYRSAVEAPIFDLHSSDVVLGIRVAD